MKRFVDALLPVEMAETIDLLLEQLRHRPLPLQVFLLMCLNLVVAPAVYATTGEAISRKAAYAIGLLALVTLALTIYLFVVVFQPERF